MYPHCMSNPGRVVRLTVASAVLAAAGQVAAAPPTASSAPTTTAREAYRTCLLQTLGKLPTTSPSMAVWSATDACTRQEIALTAAVLAENADHPLFAKSHALSIKDAAVAQFASDAILGSRSTLTVARMTRP
jgi:hypothetical protein